MWGHISRRTHLSHVTTGNPTPSWSSPSLSVSEANGWRPSLFTTWSFTPVLDCLSRFSPILVIVNAHLIVYKMRWEYLGFSRCLRSEWGRFCQWRYALSQILDRILLFSSHSVLSFKKSGRVFIIIFYYSKNEIYSIIKLVCIRYTQCIYIYIYIFWHKWIIL